MLTPKQVGIEVKKYKQPNSIVFSLTSKCPLACKYCYVDDIYGELTANYIKQCVYELENTFLPICFNFFGGEPAIRCDVIDEALSFINQSIPCTIITSGINIEGVRKLSEKHKNFYIILSFDGPYNNQRVLKNGEPFDLSKTVMPHLERVTVRTTISTSFDYRNIDYVYNWCQENHFDWSFGWQEGIDSLDTIDWENLQNSIYKILKNTDIEKDSFRLPHELMRGIIAEYLPVDPEEKLGCDYGHNLIINSKGVFPCVGSQYALDEVSSEYPQKCHECTVKSCHGQCLASNQKKKIEFNELHCIFYKKVSQLYRNIVDNYIKDFGEETLKRLILMHKLYYKEKCVAVDHSDQYVTKKHGEI